MSNTSQTNLKHPHFNSDQSLIEAAIEDAPSSRPQPQKVVNALANLEKAGKKATIAEGNQKLLGQWRLHFITGTKKTRQRAGIMLGAGRYLPKWIKIQFSYAQTPDLTLSEAEAGGVENSVKIGALKLTLSGPTKFFPKQKLLAFDFTAFTLQLGNKVLYSGKMRGGDNSRDLFYQEPIKKQAFFRYFLIEEDYVAARGRGGGLALWRREREGQKG